ncbi:MAG: hypothetical protein HKO61_06915 [Flavobacteriaceae bacterium]|nr:hypothetical protein [Bacteroidia bacterium]NNM08887.1 hypothetical protein [Flavobacteriaceae bacterium]
MKHCIYLLLALLIIACQEAPKKKMETSSPKSLLDSIADAYGYQSWADVEQISFTFNVDRPTRKSARSWHWDIKNSLVRSTIDTVTVQYNKQQVDSTMMGVDARFINDSYWLLFPFKLVWDRDSFTYEVESMNEASNKEVVNRKVTISYGDSGGYTPGDVYDFYINSDYHITEWTWRKSNDSVARIRTKLARPEHFNGLWFNTHHQGEDELSIYFSGVEVLLKD